MGDNPPFPTRCNAFNHPNFATPNASPSSGNFGKIITIGPVAPRVRQAALKLTF